MAKLFSSGQQGTIISPRAKLAQQYTAARSNLLLVVIFTLVNVILVLANSNKYFLFSAHIPYIIVSMAKLLCGRYEEEFYVEVLGGVPEYFLSDTVFYVMLAIAFVSIALYLLCFFFSAKGRWGWLIVSLVFIIADTLYLFYNWGFSIDSVLDYLFHAWIIYYLITGIRAIRKLKALPEEEEVIAADDAATSEDEFSYAHGFAEEESIPAAATEEKIANEDESASEDDSKSAE